MSANIVTPEIQDSVSSLYIAFFGRAPDARGFGYWTEEMAGGVSPYAIAANFARSSEWLSNYGGLTPTQQVTLFYNNVFDRDPDTAGLNYWVSEINGGTPVSEVAYQIIWAAYLGGAGVDPDDNAIVLNKIAVAEYFAMELKSNDTAIAATAFDGVTQDEATVQAAEDRLYAEVNPPVTYSLTTGADNIQGDATNDTINGLLTDQGQQTFQTWDTIDGGAGTNTLNVQNTGANVITATLANIQNLNFQDQSAAGSAVTLNLQGLSTLNNMSLDGNGAGSGYTVNNLGSLPAVTLSGTNVASTINFTSAALSPAGQNLNLTLTGVTGGGLTLSDAGTNALETVTIDSTNAANVLGGLTTTNLGVTSLSITGEQNLNLGVITDTTAAGATLRTIDASGATGDVTLTTVAGVAGSTVTGGSGNDTFTSGSVGDDSLIGGAGNDTFVMGANFGMTDTIDGGTGTNTISTLVANANGYNTAQSPVEIANIQTLTITDAAAAATFNTSRIATSINAVRFDAGTAGADAITGNAGAFSVRVGNGVAGVLGGALTVTDTGTATTDSLTVTSNGAVGIDALGTVALTSTGYETLTVNTNSSTAAGAQTLGAVTVTPDTGGTPALIITGSNQLTVGAVTATNGSIDASGMTLIGSTSNGFTMVAGANTATTLIGSGGVDTLFGDNGTTRNTSVDGREGADTITTYGGNDTILGGAGNDVITGGAGNDSIDAGAGDDRVVFTSGQLTANDTISGGDGAADVLSFETWLDTTDDVVAAQARVSNFEVLRVLGATAANESVTLTNFINNTGFTTIQLGANAGGTGFDFVNASTTLNTMNVVNNGAVGATAVQTISFDRLTDTATDALTVSNTINGAGAGATFTALTALDEETITLTASVPTTAGNNDLTITTLTVGDLTTLNINSASDVVITNAIVGATQLATVNASTATGAVTVNASNSIQSVTMTGNANSAAITTFTGSATVADSITGGGGADVLVGQGGNDTISGGGGADVITGGLGADSMTGGAGSDDFIQLDQVSAAGAVGADTISDFSVAGADQIGNWSIGNVELFDVPATASALDLVLAGNAATSIAAGQAFVFATVTAAYDLGTAPLASALLIDGNFNATTLATALEAGGSRALTANGAFAAGDGFYVAYDDGANTYIALLTTDTAVLDDATFAAGDIAITNLVTLTGISDATTLTAANTIAFVV